MLARSVPQLAEMRDACFTIGRQFAQPGTAILDLGCSRGEALAPFVRHFGVSGGNRYIGVESSEPMLAACRERFATLIASGAVDIRALDLRASFPKVGASGASVTLSILTTQFLPMERRQRLLSHIYEASAPGAALIMVEKVLGATADIDDLLVARYYDLKEANGYSRAAIETKRLALEGVLVPVTARWNEEMLRGAGFGQVDCFWRWMNFAGWLAIKGERRHSNSARGRASTSAGDRASVGASSSSKGSVY